MRLTFIFLFLLLFPTKAKAELPQLKPWHFLVFASMIAAPDFVIEHSSEYEGLRYLGSYNLILPLVLENRKPIAVAVSPIVRYQFGSHTKRTDLGGRVYFALNLDGGKVRKADAWDVLFVDFEYDRVLEQNATSNKYGTGLGWGVFETRFERTINPDFYRSSYSLGLTFALPWILLP